MTKEKEELSIEEREAQIKARQEARPVLCPDCGTKDPLDIATNGWCIRCKYGDSPYH